ncbi:AAA family ATPase [Nocardia sp. NPDC049190]|uniref:ATP-binding protein n=1 Tax=Nocardia sp. NPDC049190 TaxID=3155650 RepID=UPI0033F53B88
MAMVQARGGVLPASTSEFIGRETELDRLGVLLDSDACLVTLVGPGGIGKTRLAAEVLRRCPRARRRPVYWARLAELEPDSTATAQDVMQSAVRTELGSRPTADTLVRTLTSGAPSADRAVLVLDNCEHLLGAIGAMIADLLEAAPGLTILATSREPIGWVDEYILAVPPLSACQSLELFRRRAELVRRTIPDVREQVAIAARICRRVDHNPLFIRLAAARLRHQPPVMVLRELTGDADDKRLHWTHGARAGAEQRHRGVYDVVAWSFALCAPKEQLLLERLSVFAAGYETDDESRRGGIELDAAIAVCADEALPAGEIDYLLERLAEQSLLSTHHTTTTVSWYLVESVRVFARDRLRRRDRGESDRLAARHRRYFLDKVIAGQAMWLGPQDQAWLRWVRLAWNDIVLGIESGLADPAQALVALETATVLLSMKVPFVRSGAGALIRLTERALDATRACGLGPSGLGDLATALLGWIALWQGRTDRIARLLADCVTFSTAGESGAGPRCTDTDVGLSAPVEWMWGLELMMVRADRRAITVLTRARRKFGEIGDRIGAERSDVFVAFCAALVGDRTEALDNTARFLERSVSSGSTLSTAWAEIARAVALAKHGAATEACALTSGVLTRHAGEQDTWTASWAVGAHIVALAQLLVADRDTGGDPATATEIAYLVGSFTARQRSMGIAIDQVPLIAAEIRRASEVSRAVLGDRAYAAAERRTRPRPELDELWWSTGDAAPAPRRPDRPAAPRPPSRRPSSRWCELSEAERDVAVFAAAGWSNSAIASCRHSSIRTVDAQVAAIRRKLMIVSRADIVDHIPEELGDRVRYESERRPRRSRRSVANR